MIRAAALLVLICPVWMAAQKRPARKPAAPAPKTAPASPAWPVESITVEGNRQYTQEQILGVAGLAVGQNVVAKDFEAARERLVASGAFASVGYKFAPAAGGKGYALSLEVTELGPMFPIRFEDLGVPDAALQDALKHADPFYGDRIPASEPLLKRYAAVIEQYLASQNHSLAVVGRLAPDDTGQVGVLFRPTAQPLAIARVRFTDNKILPSAALENAINGVAIGLSYRESRMRTLLDTSIRPLYEARGRVRVAFPELRTENEAKVNGLVVTVKVDEGESYSLGDVKVEGSDQPAADMLKAAALKTGDVFNLLEVQAAVARLEKRVRREGFMHVKVDVRRQVIDQQKKVDVTLHIEPGPRYQFGKLEVQGLDIISEPAIRKMWSLNPGQPFNADYPDYFLARVRDEGLFDNLGETKAVVQPNEDARTVDVTLLFKGAPPKPVKKPWEPQN